LRLGWLVAPPALLLNATMCKQFSDSNTSNVAQAIAAHYLKRNRLADTLAVVRSTYAQRAQAMGNALRRELGEALVFNQPRGGMFFWARLTGRGGRACHASELSKRAIAQGVAFVPGAAFFAHDPDLASLRLSFATVGLDQIETGIQRLAKAL
jgi:DNA-binding transcriptional MocR family regulator